MFKIRFSVKEVSFFNNQGKVNTNTTISAKILGTKVRVISWIWVTACKILMTKPTIKAVSKKGPETKIQSLIDSLANVKMVASVILSTSSFNENFLLKTLRANSIHQPAQTTKVLLEERSS